MELLTTIPVETVAQPAVLVPTLLVSVGLCTGLVARIEERWQDRRGWRSR